MREGDGGMVRRMAAVWLVLVCCVSGARALEAFPAEVAAASPSMASMEVEAAAALLVDETYGRVLYEQNAHERRYPASITKVMTCLLAIEAVEDGQLGLDDPITAGADLYTGIGSGGSTQNLKEGESLPVRDLLYCAMLPSANEACNVLAQAVAGDIPSFVALMNQRADQLGMADTHFANTHGYHDENHYTTAYDIYLLLSQALTHPLFCDIVSTTTYTVAATNLSEERQVKNSNALLSAENTAYYCPDAIGVKTGSTPEAGYCLASAAQRSGHTVVAVVLGAQRIYHEDGTVDHLQFQESKRLLEWGLNNFSIHTLASPAGALGHVGVELSKETDRVDLLPTVSLTEFLPDDLSPDGLTYTLDCPESVEAPVAAGQVLGTVTISCGETVYGTLELAAARGAERSLSLYLSSRFSALMDQLWFRVVLGAAAVVLVALAVLIWLGSRQGPKGRRGGRRVASRR